MEAKVIDVKNDVCDASMYESDDCPEDCQDDCQDDVNMVVEIETVQKEDVHDDLAEDTVYSINDNANDKSEIEVSDKLMVMVSQTIQKEDVHAALAEEIVKTINSPMNIDSPIVPPIAPTQVCEAFVPRFQGIIKTLLCYLVTPIGVRKKIRIFFDSGSTCTLLRREIAEELGLDSSKKRDLLMCVSGGDLKKFRRQLVVSIKLESLDHSYITPFSIDDCVTSPIISTDIPKITCKPSDFSYMNGFNFTESMPYDDSTYRTIDVLLGIPYYDHIVNIAPINGEIFEPTLQLTQLGNLICGAQGLTPISAFTHYSFKVAPASSDVEPFPDLKQFWSLENLGIKDDDNDSQNKLTLDEIASIQKMEKCTFYNSEECYWVTSLLFKDNDPLPDNNWKVAAATSQRHISKYVLDSDKWNMINGQYQNLLDMNFASKVPYYDLKTSKKCHYISTHPVFRPESESTPCRLVFDCAQKLSDGRSFNDHILDTPSLYPDIGQLLMRFRTYAIGCVFDLRKFFNTIRLQYSDRQMARFTWCLDPKNSPSDTPGNPPTSANSKSKPSVKLTSYSMDRLFFGAKSSPFQSSWIVKKHSEQFKHRYPEAHFMVNNNLYVDDCLYGSDCVTKAFELTNQLQWIFQKAGIDSHKFASNCPQAIAKIDPDLRSQKDVVKVLGMSWNTISDKISVVCKTKPKDPYNVCIPFDNEEDQPQFVFNIDVSATYTKRSALSCVAKIFDIAGYCSPYTLLGKLVIQECFTLKLDWDSQMEGSTLERFLEFVKELKYLEDFTLKRCVLPFGASMEYLVAMSDASGVGYGCVVYLVVKDAFGVLDSNIIFSKSKVKPTGKKGVNLSLPKMELLACQLATKCGGYCQEAISGNKGNIPIFYFTDSLLNLWRIKTKRPGQYHCWTGNRLLSIQQNSDPRFWKFIEGSKNSADLCSRGSLLSNLRFNSFWLNGHPDIKSKETFQDLPDFNEDQLKTQDAPFVPKKHVSRFHHISLAMRCCVISNVSCTDQFLQRMETVLERFEKWRKIVNSLAYVRRFISNLRKRVSEKNGFLPKNKFFINLKNRVKKCQKQNKSFKFTFLEHSGTSYDELFITPLEYNEAELWWFRLVQAKFYHKEISQLQAGLNLETHVELKTLLPFFDQETKLLKSDSRIPGYYPILLPRKSVALLKFIKQKHDDLGHCTIEATLAAIRRRVWCPRGRQTVRRACHGCGNCEEVRMAFAKMGKLPQSRLPEKPAIWTDISCDAFGPLFYRDSNNPDDPPAKCWVMLFCDLFTRQAHLELQKNLTTTTFFQSFRKCAAIRGAPSTIFVDRAAYYVKANSELRSLLAKLDWNNLQREIGAKHGTTFIFNVETAAFRNGCAERLVRSSKAALKSSCGAAFVEFEELQVLVTEASALLNSRVLGVVSDLLNEPHCVTPNELCSTRNVDILPDEPKMRMNSELSKKFRVRKLWMNRFWRSFYQSYLLELAPTRKWFKRGKYELKIGQVVQIRDDNMIKGLWKNGCITELIPGKDGVVRTVKLRVRLGNKDKTTILTRPITRLGIYEHDIPFDNECAKLQVSHFCHLQENRNERD